MQGRSGAGPITAFDAGAFETRIACEVKGFDPEAYVDKKEAKRTDRFIQFAIAAAMQAVEQSRVEIAPIANEVATFIGSGIGGLNTVSEQAETLAKRGPRKVSPFLIPMMVADMAAGKVSIHLGAKGPCICVTTSCCSGADSLGEAAELIRRGDAKVAIAGGSEACITPLGVAGFNAAGALSRRNDDPLRASRPFDVDRDGFVMGEGAAVLILESLEHAEARGADILAEFTGFGYSADAHHITQPPEGGEGGVRSMRMALRKAGLRPDQIDYINAHGTSTQYNDRAETAGIKTVFGEAAYRLAVSSTKSMTGHLLGAGGPMEAAFSIMAIQNGMLPPTINYENADPDCDLDYVPNTARPAKVRAILSNSFGFGGHNTTLIFQEFKG
jgi:3-oxoacyl-[acyl-carrier-protein] synthase II